MQIIAANTHQTASIVQLLKLSLGEELMPKTEALWQWKHLDNPFGTSHVLLAASNETLVGVRAFMQWQWQRGNQTMQAMRAVDTATHPSYQQKGIFKKLTLQALEDAKLQENISFIFNSPNKKSKPGYLKMGWQLAGHLPIQVIAPSVLPEQYDDLRIQKHIQDYAIKKAEKYLAKDVLKPLNAAVWHTPLNAANLKWRYIDCPVIDYGIVYQRGLFGFVFRLKAFKKWIELRLCDYWCTPQATHLAQKALKDLIKDIKPMIVSGTHSVYAPNFTKLVQGVPIPMAKGPLITIHPLCNKMDQKELQFSKWQPSVGSMELF